MKLTERKLRRMIRQEMRKIKMLREQKEDTWNFVVHVDSVSEDEVDEVVTDFVYDARRHACEVVDYFIEGDKLKIMFHGEKDHLLNLHDQLEDDLGYFHVKKMYSDEYRKPKFPFRG